MTFSNKSPFFLLQLRVLKGFFDSARRFSNIGILLEVHPDKYGEEMNFREVLEKLFSFGFSPLYVESAGLRRPIQFRENGYTPVYEAGRRGLYTNLPKDFVIEMSTKRHYDMIDYHPGFTARVVRSLFLLKK